LYCWDAAETKARKGSKKKKNIDADKGSTGGGGGQTLALLWKLLVASSKNRGELCSAPFLRSPNGATEKN